MKYANNKFYKKPIFLKIQKKFYVNIIFVK